ncbi:MAG: cytochrome c3 family protein, partial [Proteobacteria bacterium]|nr:cytochrome c3 family protein [Pseudomonadota bacterium]
MRRIGLLGLAGLAGLLLSTSAGAVIIGTAHETTPAAGGGACGACHIPHAGGANRLWPASAGTTNTVGVVSPLCGSCHDSTGGYSSTMGAAASDAYVYGAASHGVLMDQTTAGLPSGTAPAASGLEYVGATGVFECTTCHNVHDDQSYRPFLRDTLNQLCARCHTGRHFTDGTLSEGGTVTSGTWGGLTYTGLANPGSHPVGTDVTGELDGVTADSQVWIPAQMRVTFDADVTDGGGGQWSLGGKLTDAAGTEGVTCVTCHAVHGIQHDGDDAGNTGIVALPPVANFLAIEQASTTGITGYSRSGANGEGDTNNGLCEGCHGVVNATTLNSPTGYAGTYAVNPGATGTFTHPVDDWDAQYDVNVTAFPTDWPVGSLTNTNMAPSVICESCHQPHPAAEIAAGRADVATTGGEYILRDSAANVCGRCHSSGFAGHHPIGMTYDSTGVSYLANVTGATGDTLQCATCHTASGAHNWTQPAGVGLDTAWLPLNNGRTNVQATEMINPNMSKTCMDCHYFMDGHGASVSPTLQGADGMDLPDGSGTYSEAEYQFVAQSMGTHYIGAMDITAPTSWRGDGSGPDTNGNTWTAPRVDILSTSHTWAGLPGGGAGYSRFGGTALTAPAVVCESCHEIEPDRNVADQHLLLGTSQEGFNGTEGVTGDIA